MGGRIGPKLSRIHQNRKKEQAEMGLENRSGTVCRICQCASEWILADHGMDIGRMERFACTIHSPILTDHTSFFCSLR
jgi:hypothetical protein